MNERMKINPAEAAAAGETDARSLMAEILTAEEGDNHGELVSDAMAEIIGLAVENRIEECTARLEAFCSIVGAFMYRSAKIAKLSEESVRIMQATNACWSTEAMRRSEDQDQVILAAISVACHATAGRIIAAHRKDSDAAVALAELQVAVQALDLESKFTETEGGEL